MDDSVFNALIAHGLRTGSLTYDEVNEAFPGITDPERLAELQEQIESHGITLVDSDDEGEIAVLPSSAPEVEMVLKGFYDDGTSEAPCFYPHPTFEELLRRHGIPFGKFGCTMADASTIHFARLRVPGVRALETWWKLRQLVPETGRWPVIRGGRNGQQVLWPEIDELPATKFVDAVGHRESAMQLLAEADRISQTPWTFRAMIARGILPHFDNSADSELAISVPRVEEMFSNDGPFRGIRDAGGDDWPIYDFVDIVLEPTAIPWQVFAYHPFGGWNDAPWPDEQLVMHRHWHERYGAELVCMNSDWYEMFVPRPPRSRHEALALIDEMTNFGEETIFGYSRGGSEDSLVEQIRTAHYWYFWWD